MALFSKSLIALGMLVTTLSTSGFADTYRHIDGLALSIQRKARLLQRETVHYRHTPEYRHLLDDTRDLYRFATHLHEVAHHHGSLAHLESDVRQLDSKFHHLEAVFDRVENAAAHGHGHVDGHTAHVKALLRSIESSIHHLQDDIRSLRHPICNYPVVPVTPHHEVYRRGHHGHGPGYSNRPRGGISFGGGSTRFTINF